MNLKFDIDNLNNAEWESMTKGFNVLELKGILRIAFKEENLSFVENLMEKLKILPGGESYKKHLDTLTVLDVSIFTETSDIHVELPYCTVSVVCDRNGKL